ncbi:hypothetical protein Rsub_07762 [Raphidocelis subcapitata]|uniref:Tctex1 domain-containing protein n=1 Tax=Raphidocelis subcapitata TaxID=307507 RepID=A0A2V0P633_9CHLO|nr:hypothetical protein Rsub_07762 [Raphidocelis subcapitata]|eukprot:GBF95334.1 hypothetical protein Rsub_07762 [Raphidocelis subcapitata]
MPGEAGAPGARPPFAEGPAPLAAPAHGERFSAPRAKALVGEVLRARLGGAAYDADSASSWAREISEEIRERLKAEPWAPRYKVVVQVVLGEQRGGACKAVARCFWDEQSDGVAQDSFANVRCRRHAWKVGD